MEISEKSTNTEHERVLFAHEAASGYRGIIAIHSSELGPAIGGTRLWNYASEEEALTDALRLSRGMTYKNALPGIPLGGGKAVIIADAVTAWIGEVASGAPTVSATRAHRVRTARNVAIVAN